MIDPNAIIVEFLRKTGTSLYSLVGARVYADELPSGYANTTAAVVVTRTGGDYDPYVRDYQVRFRVQCYGGTNSFKEANDVYLAVSDLLHDTPHTALTSGVILASFEVVGPQDLRDPDSGWPFILAQYVVTMRGAS